MGTEAAAITAIVMDGVTFSGKKEKVYDMIVNRPFLFLHKNANLPAGKDLLFMSKIEYKYSKFRVN